MSSNAILIILICVLIIVVIVIYKRNFKRLNLPSVALITGGVKCGKSLLSVKLSQKEFKKNHRRWWFAKHLFGKDIEEPLYYTNVEISFGNINSKKPHKLDRCLRLVEKSHLTREKRFNYKSIIYLQECSLTADNMCFDNKALNVDLSLWAKLIAHETKGGMLFLDTQCKEDSHYAFKRVSNTFLNVIKNKNFGLFHVLYVREMINTDIGNNNFNEDTDFSLRKVFVPFWYHHRYNRYEFSYLTDSLSRNCNNYKIHNGIVSFNKMYEERGNKSYKGVID